MCRRLHQWELVRLAYKTLIFAVDEADEGGARRVSRSLDRFKDLIEHIPRYGHAVQAFCIRDDGTHHAEKFTSYVDPIVATILNITKNLEAFQWYCNTQLNTSIPRKTVLVLRRMSSLRDLRIQGFESPAAADIDSAMRFMEKTRPRLPSLQRLVVRCSGYSDFWFDVFLGEAPSLKWLDFEDKQQSFNDFHRYATSLQNLHTLVLISQPSALGSYIGLLRQGAVSPRSRFPIHMFLVSSFSRKVSPCGTLMSMFYSDSRHVEQPHFVLAGRPNHPFRRCAGARRPAIQMPAASLPTRGQCVQ